jgi:Peptidase family M1 domain
MKKIIAVVLFNLFITFTFTFGQVVKHYDLKVTFDVPQRTIDVTGRINLDFQGQDSITFVLWKNTKIEKLLMDNEQVNYSFDRKCKSPNYYIPNGGKLVIKNKKKRDNNKTIHFAYKCDMRNVSGWAKSFSEDWIELGFYTAWYPVHNESKEFLSTIRIVIDDNYKVSGSGIVTRERKDWIIKHEWPVYDNVIIAAKDLKTKKIGGSDIGVEIVYSKFPVKDLNSISIVSQEVFKFYSNIFGKLDNEEMPYLKFVLNPLKGGGGYSRKNFVSIKASEFNQYLKSGIAHEMAHFWWNNAVMTTWEDWLNEAFAEYSKLLYLREKDSREKFNEQIILFQKWTKNSKPIRGIDRETPEAYTALYNKGSLILMEFEEKLGTENFYKLLRTLLTNKISNTEDFLNLIEKELSKKHRIWFENKLKN